MVEFARFTGPGTIPGTDKGYNYDGRSDAMREIDDQAVDDAAAWIDNDSNDFDGLVEWLEAEGEERGRSAFEYTEDADKEGLMISAQDEDWEHFRNYYEREADFEGSSSNHESIWFEADRVWGIYVPDLPDSHYGAFEDLVMAFDNGFYKGAMDAAAEYEPDWDDEEGY